MSQPPKGPVLIDLDDDGATPTPSEAPPVPEPHLPPPEGAAMTTVAALATRDPSPLARWFWRLLLALVGTLVSIAAWRFVTDLIASNAMLGWAVTALFAAFGLVCLMIVIKEIAAFSRLSRIDALHHAAETALADEDLAGARKLTDDLVTLYKGREDTRWGRDKLKARRDEIFDASGLLTHAEDSLLAPLDTAARREVEAAARQVATVTALVPLALADVAAALTANLRMIRRIAEIYGGRSGTLGSWRLTRAVMSHLVATGAVAIGDDMLEPILGGGLLGKLSRRFGEGMVNGALTARVGVAAMEVCRPLPFGKGKRPSVRAIIRSSLSGLVMQDKG
ncbi:MULTISPECIES: YcjF family protein [Mameliella]|uniref:YcjF family protein n=1 Tax=Mameliella TaxID=1434019 RepID=UPI000B533411|nr:MULTISPECIES: TIGR01620 family protein [Mameliella]MCR9274948.1 TIGR01620 family protein [Paracoccaceae bacterium]OWV59244.1 TIGR01620 family protein [Mameliella alba]